MGAVRRARGLPATVFHGWWIVLVAFMCFAVNTGLIFYAWGIFLVPLAATFGGRAPVSGAYAGMQIASAVSGLGVGRIIDQRGARPVLLAGAVILAIGFSLMSQVRTLPMLYAVMAGPVALGSTCIAALPNNAAVARWFVRRRGRALGVSTAGISAGGIVFAPLAQFLDARYGWRPAYAVLAVIVLVLLLPPIWMLSVRDPADLGLMPDGEPPTDAGARAAAEAAVAAELARSVRPDVALRQPSFWLLALAFGLTMAGLSAVLLYQTQFLIDQGMTAANAAYVLGATAAMGVVGKLGFGALLDRFDQRYVAAACFALQAVGVTMLWASQHPAVLGAYVVLYGYAMGGNATLLASLIGRTFGRLHYGAISGRLTPFVVLSQAIGVPAAGYARDVTGSWEPALAAIVLAALLAAVVVLRVHLPPLQQSRSSHT